MGCSFLPAAGVLGNGLFWGAVVCVSGLSALVVHWVGDGCRLQRGALGASFSGINPTQRSELHAALGSLMLDPYL